MRFLAALVTVGALAGHASLVCAQSPENPDIEKLRGLKEIKIVVEELPSGAAKCGINESALETSMRFILQQSRLQVVPNTPAFVYLNVAVLALSTTCVTSVSLRALVPVTILHNQTRALANIWERETLLTSSPSNAGQRTSNEVESLAKQLVVDWSSANK
jgi:hypothetical protein